MKKIFLLTICAFALMAMTSFGPRPIEESSVTVQVYKGDTVWGICQQMYDPREVRCFEEFMYEVRKDNNLVGDNVLQAGQSIVIRKMVRK